MSVSRDIEPGRMLGSCRILEQVGQGGMGTVYKAHQAALGRFVAVKVISPALLGDATALARFRREAQAIASLRHPHILTVYDFGEQDGLAYLATEWAGGGTLKAQMGAPLGIANSVQLLRPIGAALDYAHSRGVVHRDVKPANVLLHDDGTLLLSDFGLARLSEGEYSQLTASGLLLGTPAYMAPEQGRGSDVGPPADLYALGVIAYELLTGGVPFSGPTPVSIMLAHIQDPLPPARERNPELPTTVEVVLRQALAKQPADRFATASELLNSLEAAERDAEPPPTLVSARSDTVRPRPDTVRSRLETARPFPVTVAPPGRRVGAITFVTVAIVAALLVSAALVGQMVFVGAQPPPAETPPANWQLVTEGGSFNSIALDRRSYVYSVLDDQHIQMLSPNGQRAGGPWGTAGGPVEFDSLQGIAIADSGAIYVTESGSVSRVQRLALSPPDWLQAVARWGAASQFAAPVGVAVDRGGNVYVVERGANRIRKLSPDGSAIAQWGRAGSAAGQFNAPMGVAVDAQGNLYVADTGNDRIQKLSSSGEPLSQWGKTGTAAGSFASPVGVAVDSNGAIYVADTGNSRVQKLSPSGQPVAQWGTSGSGIGEFDHPLGVAVAANGDVYVADTGNHRLQKLVLPHA